MTKLQIRQRFSLARERSHKGGRVVKLSGSKRPCAVLLLCTAAVIASPAQTLKTLTSFNYTDGAFPFGLIQGTDGNFYGPTDKGGTGAVNGCNASCGSIFKITPAGILTTVHSFDDTDGNGPSGIVQASNGDFYGTTTYGGAHAFQGGFPVAVGFVTGSKPSAVERGASTPSVAHLLHVKLWPSVISSCLSSMRRYARIGQEAVKNVAAVRPANHRNHSSCR
jgi:uncharacterized repeat protein (TIGR03803 family)